ncbi:MAG: glycosyltransferase family 2 protein [Coriobacteriia bacterium]|nr:glycosyltransferase family 2 protein [Coriobacteriia bacterium]
MPCFNEEETLAIALRALPRHVEGFETVEWLIIDDGSADDTAEVARTEGVDHIVTHTHNRGLAAAFMTGVDACLRAGADVIVNTDADNQYEAEDIPLLVGPILLGQADIVVGARPIKHIEHFSPVKKGLQRLGSWAVRVASKTDIPDAPSGFRAISREAAMRLNVFNEYTYTLETIIQAGQKGMAITSVPIRVNPDLRPSRLVRSIPSYIKRSIITIVRIFVTYRPMRFFMVPGLVLGSLAILIGLRFLYFFATGNGGGHVQSLILAAVFALIGAQLAMFGFIAELLGNNHKVLEEIQWRARRADYESER